MNATTQEQGNVVYRGWQYVRRRLTAAPKRGRRRGKLHFEALEARRAMYGADVLETGLPTTDQQPHGEGEAGAVVSDFSLTDVNPNSATFNQPISPRQFLQQASAWYFGHST